MSNQNIPQPRILNANSSVKGSRNLIKKYSIGEKTASKKILSTKESC
jgi:hypothetical protein